MSKGTADATKVDGSTPALSIVIPTLNEGAALADRLDALAPLRAAGIEIVVVDGGSADDGVAIAASRCDRVFVAPRGRASQMNAGAAAARGAALLFLHADTRLPPGAEALVAAALQTASWGRFDVRIEGAHPLLPAVAALMNLRSRVTGIATGDQAIFVRREAFARAGGFPPIALMEDIALSKRLRRSGRPACLRARVTTSGRRWDSKGFWRTVFLMWTLRAAYFFGAPPARLARWYGYR